MFFSTICTVMLLAVSNSRSHSSMLSIFKVLKLISQLNFKTVLKISSLKQYLLFIRSVHTSMVAVTTYVCVCVCVFACVCVSLPVCMCMYQSVYICPCVSLFSMHSVYVCVSLLCTPIQEDDVLKILSSKKHFFKIF